jgi:hypothetical protein
LGSLRASPKLIPEDGPPPGFDIVSKLSTLHRRFARARLSQPCLPVFFPGIPQRSPPSLLTKAACGGLRPTSDCRSRRVLLHLSYSCASPCGPATLVTHSPKLLKVPPALWTIRKPGAHSGNAIVRHHIIGRDRATRRRTATMGKSHFVWLSFAFLGFAVLVAAILYLKDDVRRFSEAC